MLSGGAVNVTLRPGAAAIGERPPGEKGSVACGPAALFCVRDGLQFLSLAISSTGVSNELCAANGYDRETLVDQRVHQSIRL